MAQENIWQYWQDVLAGKQPPIHEDDPQAGYYRKKNKKTGKDTPVAIWANDEGHWVGLDGDRELHEDGVMDIWTYIASSPVTYEDYMACVDNGHWPGDIAPIDVGHNSGHVDEFTLKTDALFEHAREADKLVKSGITDKVTADKAANLRDQINRLGKELDALRKEEKQPLDEQVKAIQEKYRAHLDKATFAAGALRDCVSKYLRQEEAKAREAARVAEKEAREAAEREARENGVAVEEATAPIVQVAPISVGGQRSKKTALRTVRTAKITDAKAFALANLDHPDIQAAMQRLANSMARSKTACAGMDIIEERIAT